MDCAESVQSLMNSCLDVSNNNTFEEIHQKAGGMVAYEEISMPRTVRHQTSVETCQQKHLGIIVSATSTIHF